MVKKYRYDKLGPKRTICFFLLLLICGLLIINLRNKEQSNQTNENNSKLSNSSLSMQKNSNNIPNLNIDKYASCDYIKNIIELPPSNEYKYYYKNKQIKDQFKFEDDTNIEVRDANGNPIKVYSFSYESPVGCNNKN